MKSERESILSAYHNVFNTEEGQLVLEDLEAFTDCDDQSYEPGRTFDEVAYNEGLRAVILYIRQGMQGISLLEQEENDVGERE